MNKNLLIVVSVIAFFAMLNSVVLAKLTVNNTHLSIFSNKTVSNVNIYTNSKNIFLVPSHFDTIANSTTSYSEILWNNTYDTNELVKFFVVSDSGFETIEYNFTQPETKNFIIENFTTNFTVNDGDSGYMLIRIANIGNSETRPTISKTGNATEFFNITVPSVGVRQEKYIIFDYEIPNNTKNGLYYSEVNIADGDTKYNYTIFFDILDIEKPVIHSINFSNMTVVKMFNMTVNATDNNMIKNVSVNITGNDYSNLEYLKFENGLYVANMTIYNKGIYNFDFFVEDMYGNNITKKVTKEVYGLKTADVWRDVKFGKVKTNMARNKKIMYLYEPLNLTVKVIDLVVINHNILNASNNSYEFKLSFQGIPDFNITKGLEKTVNVEPGEVDLLAYSSDPIEYRGVIEIYFPETEQEDKKVIIFDGVFQNYTVTPDYETNMYKYPMSCKGKDKGNYQDSKYVCQIEYPIDFEIDKIQVLGSVGDLKGTITAINNDRDFWKQRYNDANRTIMYIIYAIIIIVVAFLLYEKVYPQIS